MSTDHTRRVIEAGKAEAARLRELRISQADDARKESLADRTRAKAKADKPAWMTDATPYRRTYKQERVRCERGQFEGEKRLSRAQVERLKGVVSNLALPYSERSKAARKLARTMANRVHAKNA